MEAPPKSARMDGAVHLAHKPLGWTPLAALEAYRAHLGLADKQQRFSYAGRLDPLASGLLLLLEGSACDEQATMQGHHKLYEWEVVLGFATDSFDLLGLVPDQWQPPTAASLAEAARTVPARLDSLVGPREQRYPPFSAARFRGSPLWWWAQQGRLHEVQPYPTARVHVHSAHLGCVRWMDARGVLREIERRVASVPGQGFRQSAIVARWQQVFTHFAPDLRVPIVSVRSFVSSGTYVRALAHEMGGVAWSITRVAVGPHYSLLHAHAVEPISGRLMRDALRVVAAHCRVRVYVPLQPETHR